MLRPNSHRTRDAARTHANWKCFPLMLLASSVNTTDNRSYLLALGVRVLCEIGLMVLRPVLPFFL